MLHYFILEKYASYKRSSLSGQFVSYKENKVLWILTLYYKSKLLALLANIRLGCKWPKFSNAPALYDCKYKIRLEVIDSDKHWVSNRVQN